jgi:hypothetical protein
MEGILLAPDRLGGLRFELGLVATREDEQNGEQGASHGHLRFVTYFFG